MSDSFDLMMVCPTCGRENDSTTGASPGVAPAEKPSPGSLSLCWGCRTVNVFDMVDGRLVVRVPTPEEQAEMDESVMLRKFLSDIQAAPDPLVAAAKGRRHDKR